MAKKTYSLERGGPKRIAISWKPFLKDVTVSLDGTLLGTIPNQKALREGRTYQLPDGSQLEVKMDRSWISTDLKLLRDGRPLPGSGSDPEQVLRGSYGLLYFIGGLNLALGAAGYLFRIDYLLEMGMGFISIIVGAIYLLLGYLVQKRSLAALITALILYGLESILAVFGGLAAALIVRVFILVFLARGIGAIRELRQAQR